MTVESAADRLAMLGDFGVLIDWKVGSTTTEDILVLFDNGTVQQEFAESVAALNRRATITLRSDDVPASAGGATDEVTVGGVVYHPKAVQPDGQGLSVVTLEKDL